VIAESATILAECSQVLVYRPLQRRDAVAPVAVLDARASNAAQTAAGSTGTALMRVRASDIGAGGDTVGAMTPPPLVKTQ
jgi:hypothetical protein